MPTHSRPTGSGADRVPAQRDTLYHHLAVHWTPADDPHDDRVVSHLSSTALDTAGRRTFPLADAR